MIPLIADPTAIEVALVGTGPLAHKRLRWLTDAGAVPFVYAPGGDAVLADLSGERYRPRLPTDEEVGALHLLFAAGLDDADSRIVAARARARRVIVNVEDVLPLCDAHLPAVVRRGDLLLTVSTGGRSPGLASLIRRRLEAMFPATWAKHLKRIAGERDRLRAAGADGVAINRAVADIVEKEGWLP